ncbi:hypothetical protein DFR50_1274 [Roseiarcus fermentans]|uniref:ElaB/YqjD/DUF883 family membrane-anchored ribosome-binding protein n=1 Tax=Roseiarcus fermentans TaxID=1473586 RepID=A0A366F0V2_9HYPH|nr:hypothetical protein [Roseiarcus fermentans]RBP07359.1 hypothetical protein DFR50_1274 [Roseiarcus fermentans]
MGGKDDPRRGAADESDLEAEAEDGLGRLGGVATALYKGLRDILSNNPELAKSAEDLRRSIRKSPLAAIGAAFVAGLLLALLTRG